MYFSFDKFCFRFCDFETNIKSYQILRNFYIQKYIMIVINQNQIEQLKSIFKLNFRIILHLFQVNYELNNFII